jgi:hypothetical protein
MSSSGDVQGMSRMGGRKRGRHRGWRPFEEAREFVRGLGLKGWQEWKTYSKSGQRPDDIPGQPDKVYKGEWLGMGDWLGGVSVWSRPALLAFLEDLRPQLSHLEEKELYLIIQQGGAMPALRQAFGKTSAHKILKDLKENGGRGLEQALKDTPEAVLEQDARSFALENSGEVLEAHAPPLVPENSASDGDAHVQRGESGLPTLVTGAALRAIDELTKLHHGLDDETAQYLVDNRVAALWDAFINGGPEAVEEALGGEGGYYFGLIRSRFTEELEGTQNLPVPAGWAFRPPGKQDEAPTLPNLMQRRTALAVSTRRRVGNWSGVGSGKTLSGILAGRVARCRHTLIICNKATVKGWCDEIGRAFPGTVVHTSPSATPTEPSFDNGGFAYTVLNYEKFQQPNRNSLVRKLVSAGIDFVILDEVQLVKQRDKNASYRRQAVAALLSLLQEQNRNLHVLGMSATPVINTLLEARKLLEIVKGHSFADLHTLPTVNNALAVHRALMVNGLRYTLLLAPTTRSPMYYRTNAKTKKGS